MNNDSRGAQDRKAGVMLAGLALGAALGLVSSYLYTRAADERDSAEGGQAEPVSVGQLLGIMLTVLGLLRQIAELGKPKKADKK